MARNHESNVRIVENSRLVQQKADQDADNLRTKNLQEEREKEVRLEKVRLQLQVLSLQTHQKQQEKSIQNRRLEKQKALSDLYAELQRRQDALQSEDQNPHEQEKTPKA